VVASRTPEAASRAAHAIEARTARQGAAWGVGADVGTRDAVNALANATLGRHGHFDIWVNNAGISAPYGPSGAIEPETFEAVTRTNVLGTYYGTFAALRHLVPRGSGRIINILGRGDRAPAPFLAPYGASKAWVRAFTLATAAEYRGTGVGIHAFNPGLMRTDFMTASQAVSGYEDKLRPLRAVLRLIGTDPDLPARKALWLASSATDQRTGLEVAALSPFGLLVHAVREGFGWLRGRGGPIEMGVTTVTQAGPVGLDAR
jgi:NAD(P)-dependent dehydrogenase (short-subunit alcohol dehydrogenase family)